MVWRVSSSSAPLAVHNHTHSTTTPIHHPEHSRALPDIICVVVCVSFGPCPVTRITVPASNLLSIGRVTDARVHPSTPYLGPPTRRTREQDMFSSISQKFRPNSEYAKDLGWTGFVTLAWGFVMWHWRHQDKIAPREM
jgi:hypothetical protein